MYYYTMLIMGQYVLYIYIYVKLHINTLQYCDQKRLDPMTFGAPWPKIRADLAGKVKTPIPEPSRPVAWPALILRYLLRNILDMNIKFGFGISHNL